MKRNAASGLSELSALRAGSHRGLRLRPGGKVECGLRPVGAIGAYAPQGRRNGECGGRNGEVGMGKSEFGMGKAELGKG
jgi:hypothetical protein